jgi:hypothetical protein
MIGRKETKTYTILQNTRQKIKEWTKQRRQKPEIKSGAPVG